MNQIVSDQRLIVEINSSYISLKAMVLQVE